MRRTYNRASFPRHQKIIGFSFNALIEQGHSVLVIEHNTGVIRSADWVIDLGPEAGAEGGYLVYSGKPAGLKTISNSHTGAFL